MLGMTGDCCSGQSRARTNSDRQIYLALKRRTWNDQAPLTLGLQSMHAASQILIALVAALHLWFLVLEMFLWTRPLGRRTFGLTAEFAQQTRTLAANQGLYNGFLAAGLLWGLYLGRDGRAIQLFFLLCVAVAGLFGAYTVGRKILFIQAMPALLALALLLAAG